MGNLRFLVFQFFLYFRLLVNVTTKISTTNIPKIAANEGNSGTEKSGEAVGEGEAVGLGADVELVVNIGATVGCGV